ncbi:MAG TPA: hypothetical protein VII66_02905 [Gemmatimonadaceae bacterium]
MLKTTIIAQILMRAFGVILIVLGIIFWTGDALSLVNLHMPIGLLFVITLWLLSGLAAGAHQSMGLIMLGIVCGIVVLALGMTQRGLMVGSAHRVIRVLHLLLGLAGMGIGEQLAKRTRAAKCVAPGSV